jgi:uncharacterized protein involved in response to NO
MNPIPRIPRGYCGPTLFSYGFRPFFLAGSAWAALAILIWVPQFFGELTLTTAFAPRDWHIHEMLYGYLPAVVAGFLLTAIPNWTGRLPVAGLPLVILFSLWLAGRAAMLLSALTGPLVAAIADLSFLVVLAAVALREIIAGRNWRNLRVVGVLVVLIAGNAVFHIEAAIEGVADYGIRIGIAAAIGLIMLIGASCRALRIIICCGRPRSATRRGASPTHSPGSTLCAWRLELLHWWPGLRLPRSSLPADCCSQPAFCTSRAWRAGPATARLTIASCWPFTSAIASCRSDSCSPR